MTGEVSLTGKVGQCTTLPCFSPDYHVTKTSLDTTCRRNQGEDNGGKCLETFSATKHSVLCVETCLHWCHFLDTIGQTVRCFLHCLAKGQPERFWGLTWLHQGRHGDLLCQSLRSGLWHHISRQWQGCCWHEVIGRTHSLYQYQIINKIHICHNRKSILWKKQFENENNLHILIYQ